MEGVPPSSMDDAVNHGDYLHGSRLPPKEGPVIERSMMEALSPFCKSTSNQPEFAPSFPQPMMEALSPFCKSTSNQPEFAPSFPQTMITMGGLDGASSSWINQNWPQTPSSDQQGTNQLAMINQVPGMLPQPPMNQCSRQFPYQFNQVPQCSTMLPEASQTLRFPQLPPHNLQVSGDPNQGQVDQASVIPHIDSMQQESLMPRNFDISTRHQNSFIYQPQPGHVYMTQNATTSQHDGFNQPTPWNQYIPNQGQVDQASVIPNIDNMQQENLVPLNFGRSSRSQMENLQVHGLQNQTARPNASNPGPDSSLQSQNRGLNTQQVQRAGSRDPFWNYVEEKDDESMICVFCQRRWAKKISISRFKWHLSGEEGRNVKICSGVTKEVQEKALKAMYGSNKRHKSTACSINVNDRGI